MSCKLQIHLNFLSPRAEHCWTQTPKMVAWLWTKSPKSCSSFVCLFIYLFVGFADTHTGTFGGSMRWDSMHEWPHHCLSADLSSFSQVHQTPRCNKLSHTKTANGTRKHSGVITNICSTGDVHKVNHLYSPIVKPTLITNLRLCTLLVTYTK